MKRKSKPKGPRGCDRSCPKCGGAGTYEGPAVVKDLGRGPETFSARIRCTGSVQTSAPPAPPLSGQDRAAGMVD